MVLLAVAVLAGLIAGLSRRPAGVHSVRPRVEQIPLLGLGALLYAASVVLDGALASLALATALAVLTAVAAANRHLTGVAVVGVGLLVNLVAIAVNGGTPVRASALVAADVIEAADVDDTELTGARHLASDADPLAVLGDVLPIPLIREVMSFGDLIIVIGAADAVRELSRRRAPRWTDAERRAYRWRLAATTTKVDHVWGTAPSARPVSASQYSAKPDELTPLTIDLASDAAADSSPDLVSASQSR